MPRSLSPLTVMVIGLIGDLTTFSIEIFFLITRVIKLYTDRAVLVKACCNDEVMDQPIQGLTGPEIFSAQGKDLSIDRGEAVDSRIVRCVGRATWIASCPSRADSICAIISEMARSATSSNG